MAVRAKLFDLHSPDLLDMDVNYPEDPENFGILVEAAIGEEGANGADLFGFVVCTPRWLENNIPIEGYLFGRHRVILREYSYPIIWKIIDSLCQRTWGDNWEEVAHKLNRFGGWEFEDYQGQD